MTLAQLEEDLIRRKQRTYRHEEIVIPRNYRRKHNPRKEEWNLERMMRHYIDTGEVHEE